MGPCVVLLLLIALGLGSALLAENHNCSFQVAISSSVILSTVYSVDIVAVPVTCIWLLSLLSVGDFLDHFPMEFTSRGN